MPQQSWAALPESNKRGQDIPVPVWVKPDFRYICRIEGCARLARKGDSAGLLVHPKCSKHTRRNPITSGEYKRRHKERVKGGKDVKCVRCGWQAGACHAHRIVPGHQGGEYVAANVVPLCGNCHYLVTWGKIPNHLAPLGNGEAPVVPLW